MKRISLLVVAVVACMVVCGCGGSKERVQQAKTMNNMKQVYLAKLEIEQGGKKPVLADIAASLSLDAADYEVTETWSNPDAVDGVILRSKAAYDGKHIVVYADGSVMAE